MRHRALTLDTEIASQVWSFNIKLLFSLRTISRRKNSSKLDGAPFYLSFKLKFQIKIRFVWKKVSPFFLLFSLSMFFSLRRWYLFRTIDRWNDKRQRENNNNKWSVYYLLRSTDICTMWLCRADSVSLSVKAVSISIKHMNSAISFACNWIFIQLFVLLLLNQLNFLGIERKKCTWLKTNYEFHPCSTHVKAVEIER